MKPARYLRPTVATLCLLAGLVWLLLPVIRPAFAPRPTEPPVPPGLVDLDTLVRATFESAIENVRTDNRSSGKWLALGMVYHAHDYYGPAETCYREAIERDDTQPAGWYLLAMVQVRQTRRVEAIASMQRVIDLDPRHAASYWRVGEWHLDAGRLDEADDWFRRAADVDPSAVGAWLGIVQVHLQRGEAEAALPVIERILELSHGANVAFGHQLRAAAYRMLGRHEEARVEAELGRDATPTVDDPLVAAVAAMRTGYKEEMERGLAFLETGRHREAIATFERMRQQLGEDRGILNNLGLAHLHSGDAPRAVEFLEGSVALDPDFQTSTKNLALARGHAATTPADLADAFRLIDRAIGQMPSDAAAYEVKAFLHLRRGESAEAIAAYETAVRLAPGNVEVLVRLAALLRADGRTRDAIAYYRQAMRTTFARTDVLAALAETHLDAGELAEAEAVLAMAAVEHDAAVAAARTRLEAMRTPGGG